MEYIPLVHEYANFLMPAAITLVIVSVVCYIILPFTDYFLEIAEWWNVAISSGIALLVAFVVGLVFAYMPNTNSNLEAAKTNVETKYHVTASNFSKVKGDDNASVFEAYIVDNRDQSGHTATVIVSADGTPSLIGFESLKR